MRIEWTAPLLWTLLLVVLMVATGPWTRRHYRLTTPSVSTSLRRLFITLRTLAVLLLLCAALGPVLVLERDVAEPAVVRVLVEDSGSMGMGDGSAGRSRWQTAMALTASLDSLLAARDEDVVLDVMRGNGIASSRPVDPDDAAPAATGTSLSGLLRDGAAAGRARLTVLMSDGHRTVGETAPVTRNGSAAVVGVGDPVGPPDVMVRVPGVPEEVQVGDELIVEIELALGGWGDRPVPDLTVVLEHEGREVGRRVLQPAAGDALVRCEIADTPDEAGLRLLTVRVLPVAGEALTGNNESSAAVLVREGRQRLLLLTSRPGWLVRFLAIAAASEERVDLAVVGPTASGPALVDGGAWRAPETAGEWSAWDGLILADSGAAAWIGAGIDDAAAAGLGILFVTEARERPWPAELSALWPVVPSGRSLAGSWRLGVAPGASGHSLLSGLPDLDVALRLRPPLSTVAVVEPEAGGRVVLEVRGAGADAALPVLVTRRDGAGRTAWLGSSDLWEQVFWKPPRGLDETESRLERLLANLMVWLARGTDDTGAMLLGQRHVYHEGETINIHARRLELGGRLGTPPSRLEIRPLDPDAGLDATRLTMRPVPGQEGTSRAVVGPLPPGRYDLVPLDDETAEAAGPSREIVVTATSLEDRQGTQDRTALRALAAGLGGTFHDGNSDAGRRSLLRLVGELDLQPQRRSVRNAILPWATWPFVTAVVLLLGLEWILRRRNGLL